MQAGSVALVDGYFNCFPYDTTDNDGDAIQKAWDERLTRMEGGLAGLMERRHNRR